MKHFKEKHPEEITRVGGDCKAAHGLVLSDRVTGKAAHLADPYTWADHVDMGALFHALHSNIQIVEGNGVSSPTSEMGNVVPDSTLNKSDRGTSEDTSEWKTVVKSRRPRSSPQTKPNVVARPRQTQLSTFLVPIKEVTASVKLQSKAPKTFEKLPKDSKAAERQVGGRSIQASRR
ncbi:uncharacterized protein EHS24_007208 [Apiotrichum porosum]|uniref:Uncharacterized protein n=1 Tax=Apiotrichum porosum TaxID=105984 RepID=A0A427XXH7_9TREE|nr:uncharacterized protein EHS24_007208 [Apiotrichum porosum]RSH83521.1 hypothetical protein EHS24_007208 [Apiotrichum porosum]